MKVTLRDYQQNLIMSLSNYLSDEKNIGKNPCVVAPTGSGKSVMIGAFVKYVREANPKIKVLILTHQKELIMQDATALHNIAPELYIGIYSASLRLKQLEDPIIYASVQSLARVQVLPTFHLVIIDEAHRINNEEEGQYRKLLSRIRPYWTIGFTATPYRLGQGLLTEGGIFNDLIESISISELQKQGYLALLKSKNTISHYKLDKVLTNSSGEYILNCLQNAVEREFDNIEVVNEFVNAVKHFDREHVLVFCTSVKHANSIKSLLFKKGIENVSLVTGALTQETRDEAINKFTSGENKYLINVDILTTGFDYPNIDCIVMLRPTNSPGLHLQMLGRGLRLKSGKNKDCLVLDFAGNCLKHGAVINVTPPKGKKKSSKLGAAPFKECPGCLEIVPVQTRICPECGYVWPIQEKDNWFLYEGDVNGGSVVFKKIYGWYWTIEKSRKTDKDLIRINYDILSSTSSVNEFLCIGYEGYAYSKAVRTANEILKEYGLSIDDYYIGAAIDSTGRTIKTFDWVKLANDLNAMPSPVGVLITKKEGSRYESVEKRIYQSYLDELEVKKQEMEEKRDETRRSYYNK